MALSPIAFIAPNYRDFKNDWLKAYDPGTTTPKPMALDSEGATTVAKLQLNADGFLIASGGALVIPYLNDAYDLWLFPTEAEADANDTSNAIRLADDILGVLPDDAIEDLLINDPTQAYELDTVQDFIDNVAALPVGKKIHISGRNSVNDGGGSTWEVITTGTTAFVDLPNTYDIILCTGVPAISIRINNTGFANVKQYGAVGDGVTDDTEAFNAATWADVPYSDGSFTNDSETRRTITVPGTGFSYYIQGTVYIHKGSNLVGTGQGASRIRVPVITTDTLASFKLGFGRVAGLPVVDPGGLPPIISNMATEGGRIGAPVVDATGVAGIGFYDMFVTTAPIALRASAGDAVVKGCTFDDCATAIEMEGSRNVLTGNNFFHSTAFQIDITGECFDWVITSNTFAFCEQADINIRGDANKVRGMLIHDNDFIENGQYPGKLAHILLQTTGAQVTVKDNTFSNSKGWAMAAIGDATTGANDIEFNNNKMNGIKTNDSYIPTTTAKGVLAGGGIWDIRNNQFKNLFGNPIEVNETAANSRITVQNNRYLDCTSAGAFVTITAMQSTSTLNLQYNTGDKTKDLIFKSSHDVFHNDNIDAWQRKELSGRFYFQIATFKNYNGQVSVSANPDDAGSIFYNRANSYYVSIGGLFSVILKNILQVTDIHISTGGTNPVQLDVQFDIDTLGAGLEASGYLNARDILVSVPNTYVDYNIKVT